MNKMKYQYTFRTMLFLMVLLASLSTYAQDAMVGDGFGGRAGYCPANYALGADAGFSVCGSNSQLYVWGYNYQRSFGQATPAYTTTPLAVPGMTNVIQFSTGDLLQGAIKSDGTGWVWGYNVYSVNYPTPTQVITNAYHCDGGGSGSEAVFFVKKDGTVWMVGKFGLLASCLGPTGNCATQVPGITNAKRVAVGGSRSYVLILLADGTVQYYGMFNGESTFNTTAISIPSLSNIVDIKSSDSYALFLNSAGQVYYKDATNTTAPTLVTFPSGAAPIKAIATGNGNAKYMALDDNGNYYNWGSSIGGQLGNGLAQNNSTAITSPQLRATNVRDMKGANNFNSYIIKNDGTVWGTGDGGNASIGSMWLNLSNVFRNTYTQMDPSAVGLCATPTACFTGMPPCSAGTTPPSVTPTTATNTCPATTVNLGSLAISSTTPSGASLIWSTHKTPTSAADTLTTAQKAAISTAGTYYALYYDATNTCYSPADSVTITLASCVPPFSASNPAAQTATTGATKTGNAATELAPTGGISPYIYSNGAGDAACVAPSGATLLTGLTVNSNGTYSYTTPATVGTYYYCIKVCDSNTPTASCVVKTYTLTVSAPTTLSNTCPTATVNLTTAITPNNVPSGATVTWHTGTPATTANKVADPTAINTSGTYYFAYYDGNANCYSDASEPIIVTITTCIPPVTANNPPTQTATTGENKSGNAATELAPTGGLAPYIYSNGLGDAACVALSGATALSAASNLTVNSSTGAYSYTAPATAGNYYFCIKVCDSTTPTARCVMKTYTITVTAAPTCTVSNIMPTFIKN